MSQGSAGVAAEITNEGSTSSFASFRGGRRCYSTNARQTSVLRLYVQIFICPVRLKKKTKKEELSNNNNMQVLARMEPWVFNKKNKIESKLGSEPRTQPVTAAGDREENRVTTRRDLEGGRRGRGGGQVRAAGPWCRTPRPGRVAAFGLERGAALSGNTSSGDGEPAGPPGGRWLGPDAALRAVRGSLARDDLLVCGRQVAE